MGTRSVGRIRVLALVVVVCVVAAALVASLWRTGEVRAQEAVATTVTPAVAVPDFINNSSYGAAALGRSAADALVLALDESKKFSPVRRSEVEQAMARLNFTLPMDLAAQGRLAQALEVPHVAAGTINDVHFAQTKDGRIAVVDITIALLSADIGEYVNGARVVRASTPKPGYTADDMALVEEALSTVTYDAVRIMISYEYPETTILSATPSEVYLNAGSRAGLKQDMEVAVTRFGVKVGRARILQVDPDFATAAITANYRGITVGDKALPVFKAPSTVQVAAVQRAQAKTKLSNSLLGLAAAAGIFFTMRHESPADVPVPGVAASALSDPSGASQGGILITWSPPAHEWRNVRLYEIFRNGAFLWVNPAQTTGSGIAGGGTVFIDEAGYPSILTVTLDIDPDTGQMTAIAMTAPDEETEVEPGGGPVGTNYARTFVYSPPTPGGSYSYRVGAVVAVVRFVPGGGTEQAAPTRGAKLEALRRAASSRQAEPPARDWVLQMSPFAGNSGYATAIAPPPLVSPAADEQVDTPSEVLFSWSAVAGANEYVLQISRDPLFQPISTRSYVKQTGAAEGTELSQVVNVAQDLPPAPGAGLTVLFWRVGARNLHDLVPPRTDPGLAQAYPQDQGYVWSTPGNSSFTIASGAAAAAAASGRGPRQLRWLGPRP